ncbi:glycine cleavage system aminomethyltransferase GcvT [Nocardioides rotundus]|uniref:glycine cleavage system aminomethyltransferase GcvT n=1 Tax=Nocardioides rotundus TaxID=1774216 RepID=UPI001CBD95F9|nr:glycine cleavage system aminomethyltransferase GcvT [Nocardioides rotundus]UAL31195.1 glycine cleavage system aminomethyltransferase GcvT [Nocardioides rotundus]
MASETGSTDASLIESPLHDRHVALGAKFAGFGGWSMPVEYPAGTVKEHNAVRESVGVFDVSHLGKVMVTGPGAAAQVNARLSNDLGKIEPGKAQYTLCLNEEGGIVDDLIAYYASDEKVLLVPNAANSAEVARRVAEGAPGGVEVTDLHRDYAVLAVQGRESDRVLEEIGLPVGHDYMTFVEADFEGTGVVVCRSGYTGERGYELIVANEAAGALWDRILEAGAEVGILPCGLGSRDTLRTEMGYPLHGQDLSVDVNPVEAGLSWAVGWKKDAFPGREAVLKVKEEGPKRRLRGLVATGRGIPRPGMGVTLVADVPLADITSGTFSPTLRKGIGMALLPTMVNPDAEVGVDIRGRREIFQLVPFPFVDTSVRES